MFYALINYSGEIDSVTELVYGSLESIQATVLGNDEMNVMDITDNEEEDFYSIDSYDELEKAFGPENILKALNSYFLEFGGGYTEVFGVVDN